MRILDTADYPDFRDETMDDYLSEELDDTNSRTFISSSEIMNIINQTLWRKETDALGFGQKFHLMAEYMVEGVPFLWRTKKQLELPEGSPPVIIDTPSNIAKLTRMHWLFDDYLEIHSEYPACVEYSVYCPFSYIVQEMETRIKQLHSCFNPLTDLLYRMGRGAKMRFDYIHKEPDGWVIKDWKTFTEVSLSKLKSDIWYRGYVLRISLYCIILELLGYHVKRFHLVMIPKVTSGGRIIDIAIDINRDAKQIFDYLESRIPVDVDDRISTAKEMKHNNKILYMDFFN